ncbi:hypothetical protein [Actinomadura oligospora]|uniref:hypothetical protein n=1 Tax=Actinomadura oligospora TaxID=111804 RepID=UPI00047B0EF9|nr:hypothetical protein [Actinomadura oligospora]
MFDRTVSRLVDRNFAHQQVLDKLAGREPAPAEPARGSCRPSLPTSPCCAAQLSGGPVVLWCVQCGHQIHASHLDREVTAPQQTPAVVDGRWK